MEKATCVKVRRVVRQRTASSSLLPIIAAISSPIRSTVGYQMRTNARKILSSQLSARFPRRPRTIRPSPTTWTAPTAESRVQRRKRSRSTRSSSNEARSSHTNRYHLRGSRRRRRNSANARTKELRRFYPSICSSSRTA